MSTAMVDIVIISVRGGGRLYTSESDVYRRQILTYKDDPRAKRVNVFNFHNYVFILFIKKENWSSVAVAFFCF